MKIIFMGTPEFAVPSLEKLHASKHDVLAVVTVPDKPKGRGQSVAMSDVKKKALELGLPVLQPTKLKDPEFIDALKAYNAEIFIVVAFRILPPAVYELPKHGAVNAHASLLPKYRGAAPIHWAVYHGESETGITVFQIDKKVDTGKIILQERLAIQEDDTSGLLYDKLKHISAEALLKAIDQLENNKVNYLSQDDSLASAAPKVLPNTGYLDFDLSCDELSRSIRAFSVWPGSFFYMNGQRIKVIKAKVELQENTQPGKIEKLSKKQFAIHCKDGYFLPQELQSPGRKSMSVLDWMNGNELKEEVDG